jgi:hypothetical protein
MKVLFLITALLAAPFLFAEETSQSPAPQETAPQGASDLTRYYGRELFHWNYVSGITMLEYRHQTSSITLKINPMMKEALSAYPESKSYVDSYAKSNKTGNALIWSGLAVMMTGLFLPLMVDDWWDGIENDEFTTGLKVMVGGLIAGEAALFAGSYVVTSAYEKLFQAVALFNRKKIGEYRPERQFAVP